MKYTKTKYPDGSFYVTIQDFSDPVIRERINNYEDLWLIRQIKDVCDFNNVKVSLEIPCLLDAQADRRFNPNESSNLKLVCKFINSLEFESVKVFHPHNPEVVEALLDNVTIINNHTFVKNVLANISSKVKEENLILVSTDAGGFKPLMKLADGLSWKGEVFAASKARKWEEGKTILTQLVDRSDFGGKSLLIIDDLCVYGGTFLGLSNAFVGRNCGYLFLAVSHMTVQKPNQDLAKHYDRIYTTRSKFDKIKLKNTTLLDY